MGYQTSLPVVTVAEVRWRRAPAKGDRTLGTALRVRSLFVVAVEKERSPYALSRRHREVLVVTDW
ncbi:hypothetical protein SAMD00079811_56540 [Scytonema sp. HK-05]|uniref:hypothetical protein n=1 Tax=Scytonema sp. HK-05 TaxID=1137095 RepID=UPI0009379ED3|nr:hypothetical protein [Scytonema sp. HK-05]OKH57790.1 hypothetical protein NIES2130_18165 [Scytonema sp. HK-05]BAY48035.1 hypothetical protein SAMD00079811_56540 [Scytonema sp. HK-05]